MTVLVSACVLGCNCKYNGGNNFNKAVVDFVKDKEIIEVCPELLAGLGAPRSPAEIVEGKVKNQNGEDVDSQFRLGVEKALELITDKHIEIAILQSRSPTCGVNNIYDGTFSGKLIAGKGIFAKALADKGINVVDSEDFK